MAMYGCHVRQENINRGQLNKQNIKTMGNHCQFSCYRLNILYPTSNRGFITSPLIIPTVTPHLPEFHYSLLHYAFQHVSVRHLLIISSQQQRNSKVYYTLSLVSLSLCITCSKSMTHYSMS